MVSISFLGARKVMSNPERTPAEWFEEADRCYIEGHQACAWCRTPHQVRRVETETGVAFHCGRCDFHAAYNPDLHRYQIIPGERNACRPAPPTMHDAGLRLSI